MRSTLPWRVGSCENVFSIPIMEISAMGHHGYGWGVDRMHLRTDTANASHPAATAAAAATLAGVTVRLTSTWGASSWRGPPAAGGGGAPHGPRSPPRARP